VLGALLVVEVLLGGFLVMPIFMHTQRERRALSAWIRDRSPDNARALQEALAEIERTRWLIRGAVLILLAANTVALVTTARTPPTAPLASDEDGRSNKRLQQTRHGASEPRC
jgi:hypothetical protein